MSKTDQLNIYGLDDLETVASSVETDEAYTFDTPKYPTIKTVMDFYGEIGLDPTSNPEKSIPAKHHFTKEDNCLIQDWTGKGPVFMNPPYSTAKPFLEKALEEYHAGNVPEVIFLLLSTTASNRKVGPLLRSGCSAFCLMHGRPPFRFGSSARKGEHGSLPVPSVLFYAGKRPTQFCREFMRLGTTAYTYPLDSILMDIA